MYLDIYLRKSPGLLLPGAGCCGLGRGNCHLEQLIGCRVVCSPSIETSPHHNTSHNTSPDLGRRLVSLSDVTTSTPRYRIIDISMTSTTFGGDLL